MQLLSITTGHIYALEKLPNHHRDPFDRLLIAQAMTEQMPLLSVDTVFDQYPIIRSKDGGKFHIARRNFKNSLP